MALYLPHRLPAIERLRTEGFDNLFSIREIPCGVRPKRIALLNLMPVKESTEEDFARILANAPCDIELILLRIENHVSKNTSNDHLEQYYKVHRQIENESIDGIIITGAPVELIDFDAVSYWEELTRIFQWADSYVRSALFICWGAQAALYHYYKVPKHILPAKQFGVFEHSLHHPAEPLFKGFDDRFLVPHSRHTATLASDLIDRKELRILSTSPDSGVYIVGEQKRPFFYITGHSEYAPETLNNEYKRDLAKGLPINIPYNYFENDDPNARPVVRWRAHAHHMFLNWVKYYLH